ncbi:riboflavin synthase, alpha subunit [Prochlorococcus marinus str. MIT 9312]|uniref:Riboflavin synthase n=1 Tax=Prochlorococcus marinus (strain MIT 9312) TaxID=74546 RepID=Q31C93_PROM9|nr:riboflavin synthase [Prochlorococcus marinus]ABB49502.1 riboflavin synthase, alpha subunit [Prochlorococcus marinus str. MIT 9312]KGG01158.1 Riboflavin synthase eubacterial/eukaryotic [Prochlorococcus marinus str. MIT 9311]
MFTGIIQTIGKLKQEKNILEIEIIDNFFDMAIGDSIAVDGICLTVKEIIQNKFTVDVSEETLKRTTLGIKSKLNQIVNLEPALRISDRLGGHIVSGHIDGLGIVENIQKLEKSWLLTIKWKNKNFSKYVVNKGSICVNGISLTIAKYEKEGEIFTIAIIPHTWHNTNLNKLNVGESVNLEADALIKYVEKLLLFNKNNKEDFSTNNISSKWLKENGW